jgi:hypothetical protein
VPDAFAPSFLKVQADIEGYLVAQGKREKTKDGFVVFRGYDDALRIMFNRYMEQEAFHPLVSHFRAWNWEHSYNDYLLRLTDALLKRRDWRLLSLLWSGVIAKRRKLYNDIRAFDSKSPGKLKASSVKSSRENFLETLERVKSYSVEIGSPEDAELYERMISKVKAGRKV